MTEKGIIRAAKCSWSRNFLLLRLFRVGEDGQETLLATSSPVTKVAAAGITRIFGHGTPLNLDTTAIKNLFKIFGRTGWASFTDLEPARAALKACLQHDMETAKAVLVVISLGLNSHIVHDVSIVLTNFLESKVMSVYNLRHEMQAHIRRSSSRPPHLADYAPAGHQGGARGPDGQQRRSRFRCE